MNPLITVGIDPLLPYATGTGFSATFFVAPGESSPGSLVDLFEEAAKDGGGGWPIQWDTINGLKTVKVTVLGGWYLWFDPSSGYALRKFIQSPRDNTTGRWFAFKELDVSGLVEAAKGIWFPTRATYVGPVDGVGPHIRLTYQAEKIIVNNPSFDPHIFTVPIPPKCKLHDAINHRSFIVENISEIDDSISKDVKVLKAQGQQEPATVTSEVVPPAAVIFGTETRWDFRITYVLIVAAGGVLVVFLWRRLKSTRSSLVVFLTAMLFCVAFAHKSVEADGLANSSSDAVSVNCGVCDACFCLQWFNRNADLEQVANQMSAGEFYDRPCSMWDLKQTINNYNLQADGFKADSIKEIVNSLQPTSLAIVQLSPGPDGNDLGHYVVLVRVRSQMAVVDPPAPIRFCTKEEIVNDLELSRATGAFLLVSERQSAPKVFGPSFNISSQVINVGHVPVNKPEFTASFSYTDVGTEPLKILNTRLPCSCMKPPTGDFTVLPGQTGTIYVPFTRNTLGGGHVSRSILLQTNDPHHAAVSIRFEMDLDPISLPTELSVAPRQVDYGRSDAQGVVDQPVIITVTIPHKTKASAPSIIQTEVSSHEITLEPVKDSADDRNMPMGDGIWWEMVNYKMRWLEIPRPGNISENLTFKVATADGRNETFEVGVRGEIPAAP
jgi:hypothetical protein